MPKDAAEAAKWYGKPADQGLEGPQYELALLYFSGTGLRQDFVRAHMWVNLAVTTLTAFIPTITETHPKTKFRIWLDSMTELRDKLTTRTTTEQLAEAQRLAREWRPIKMAK